MSRSVGRPASSGVTASADRFELFAVTAPGLESIVREELVSLGVRSANVVVGGVAFRAVRAEMYRANLCLRAASRVIARVGEFHARGFNEVEKHGRRQPWERFLTPERAVRLRVTCRKSRLYHSDAVAERLAGAIEARVPGMRSIRLSTAEEEGEEEGTQLVVARLLRDVCTLSVDTSGDLLHLRGYRQATAKAPLRETLAAGCVLASGWDPAVPLLDPLCGSGTIAIEAALRARCIPPGLGRRFAFMEWPDFDSALWSRLTDQARSGIRPTAPAPIQGSDRDQGAIEACRANAERAGVAADIDFREIPLSAIAPPPGPGWLVTNPPYGMRVGERDRLRNLYAQLGHVARRKCPGWTLTLLSADTRLEAQVGIHFEEVLRTRNGGILVRLVRGVV